MKKHRVAVIGLGGMGIAHLKTLQEYFASEVFVVAGVDPRKKARDMVKREFGIDETYADVHDLVKRSTFDYAVVATPSDTHYPIVRQLAGHCDAILLEKPLAHTAADCRKIRTLAKKWRGKFYVDLEARTDRGLAKTKEIVAAGKIGTPRVAWFKEFRCPFLKKPDRWIQQQERSGGALVDKCVHYFDLFGWYFDAKPVSVTATGGRDVVRRLHGAPYTVMDNALASVEYAGSKRATVILCMFIDKPIDGGSELGIIGEKGMAVYAFEGQAVRWTDASGRVRTYRFKLPDRIAKVSHRGMLYTQHKGILADLAGKHTDIAGVDAAYWATLTALAGERSAATGRLVKLSELHRKTKG